jgi:hypothetical protein
MSSKRSDKLRQELSDYIKQLDSDDLTIDERSDIISKVRHIKIQLFLDGIEEKSDAT